MSSDTGSTIDVEEPSRSVAPELPRLFDALSDARRCLVLAALRSTDGPIAETELASRVLEYERGTSIGEGCSEPRQVHVTLRHRHLPKLEEYGVVDRGAVFEEAYGVLESGCAVLDE
ncbi:hypothetical protein ACFOZ7_09020 [Natribaculum luteum]|uniref:DUF7344 domain-containing protein n=1 Tax=Natribaculum luteum TaxID=1586232 RepID=A0ABD5NYW8_9EURY|nr:hypothetical protein [Natribaculum luteum]